VKVLILKGFRESAVNVLFGTGNACYYEVKRPQRLLAKTVEAED